jgi:hypothetical protein
MRTSNITNIHIIINIFINALYAKINHSRFLLFAHDLKIYHDIKSVEDCKALQADTDSVHQWFGENCTQLSIQETKMISVTRKSDSVHFNYYVKDVLILHSGCKKDLRLMIDSKFYFHRHVDFVYSQTPMTLRLIRFITYNFSSLDSLVVLHMSLIRSKSMPLSYETILHRRTPIK